MTRFVELRYTSTIVADNTDGHGRKYEANNDNIRSRRNTCVHLLQQIPSLQETYKFDEYGAVAASLDWCRRVMPANGRKVFMNRKKGNCLACHVNDEMSEQSFHGEVGPELEWRREIVGKLRSCAGSW